MSAGATRPETHADVAIAAQTRSIGAVARPPPAQPGPRVVLVLVPAFGVAEHARASGGCSIELLDRRGTGVSGDRRRRAVTRSSAKRPAPPAAVAGRARPARRRAGRSLRRKNPGFGGTSQVSSGAAVERRGEPRQPAAPAAPRLRPPITRRSAPVRRGSSRPRRPTAGPLPSCVGHAGGLGRERPPLAEEPRRRAVDHPPVHLPRPGAADERRRVGERPAVVAVEWRLARIDEREVGAPRLGDEIDLVAVRPRASTSPARATRARAAPEAAPRELEDRAGLDRPLARAPGLGPHPAMHRDDGSCDASVSAWPGPRRIAARIVAQRALDERPNSEKTGTCGVAARTTAGTASQRPAAAIATAPTLGGAPQPATDAPRAQSKRDRRHERQRVPRRHVLLLDQVEERVRRGEPGEQHQAAARRPQHRQRAEHRQREHDDRERQRRPGQHERL